MCEKYLDNEFNPQDYNPFMMDAFIPLKKVLDARISAVMSSELMLYSDRLRAAGTTDLIAMFDDELCLCDFKTSKRLKTRNEIIDYFLQSTAYSCMAYEMLGIEIKTIVIIMLVEGGDCLVFKEDVSDHISAFMRVRKLFKEKNGI